MQGRNEVFRFLNSHDALASLNKVVNIAFTRIQDQTRLEVTQASTEAREAHRERDEAVPPLDACTFSPCDLTP
ncbi:hypothetical protein DFH29DRAFT_926945, partial [Suillus ampliporus]